MVGFHMSCRYGEAIYEIQVENTEHRERGVAFVELDGQRVKDGVITLNRELVKHRVLVRMGKPAPADWDAHLGVGVKANDYT